MEQSFEEIERILSEIDVRIVLKPLTERLDEIQSELDDNLKRVGDAFGSMTAAIPV